MAKFYQLTNCELEKLGVVERAFERTPTLHSSYLYQNINLDWREPTSTMHLINTSGIINPSSIKAYLGDNVFAIDIITADDVLSSRYILVPKDNFCVNDAMRSSFKLSEHMSGSMSNPKNDVLVYTLDDIFEE